jgi:hypothetical protein
MCKSYNSPCPSCNIGVKLLSFILTRSFICQNLLMSFFGPIFHWREIIFVNFCVKFGRKLFVFWQFFAQSFISGKIFLLIFGQNIHKREILFTQGFHIGKLFLTKVSSDMNYLSIFYQKVLLAGNILNKSFISGI